MSMKQLEISTFPNDINKNDGNGDDEPLYCHCNSPYEDHRSMIACDGCEQWFHTECVGITEEDLDKIDLYFCEKCEHDHIGETRWKVKCRRSGCSEFVSSLEARKYCSDECGIHVAKGRLKKLFADKLKTKKYAISFDKSVCRAKARIEDTRAKLLIELGQLKTKMRDAQEEQMRVFKSIHFADCLAYLAIQAKTSEAAICGYIPETGDLFDKYGSKLNKNSVDYFRSIDACFELRNKCAKHGKNKILPIAEVSGKINVSDHPLKSDVSSVFDCDFPVPFWGILHANKAYLVIEETEKEISDIERELESIETQMTIAKDAEFDIKFTQNNSENLLTISLALNDLKNPKNFTVTALQTHQNQNSY